MNLEFEGIVLALIEKYTAHALLEQNTDVSTASVSAQVKVDQNSDDNNQRQSVVKEYRNRRDEALPINDYWTEERRERAAIALKAQGDGTSSFWRDHYISKASRYWHEFYKRNEDRFYKDNIICMRNFPNY